MNFMWSLNCIVLYNVEEYVIIFIYDKMEVVGLGGLVKLNYFKF